MPDWTPVWSKKLNVVLVGQTFAASRTVQRVSALRDIGCLVDVVPTTRVEHNYETPPSLMARLCYRLRRPQDLAKTNETILSIVKPDTDILWLDAADTVQGSTLREAKRLAPNLRIIWYSEDDLMNKRLRTVWLESSIPYIDLWSSTKSFNLSPAEMPSLGVGQMFFVNNSYDPSVHRPIEVTTSVRTQFSADIGFVGTYEAPRAQSLMALAMAGMKVRVWGNGWQRLAGQHPNLMIEGKPVYNDDYASVISATAINLCFLRYANRDLQTCRSVEIPACGGFMVHERNVEITGLFRENQEAVYFDDDDELLMQCEKWLSDVDDRARVSASGLHRVQELRLDHHANATRILNAALSDVTGVST